MAFGGTELCLQVGCPCAQRACEFGCTVGQHDRDSVPRLELVAGLGVEGTRRADDGLQRRQIVLGDVGVEQHADDGGLHPGSIDAVRLYRVDEPLDGKPLQHHDPPGVVHARHELAHPDAAELPIGELRRGVGRSVFSAGDAEDRALQHFGSDRLPFRRAGGAAGQDLKRHTGFGVGVLSGAVAALEVRDRGDGRRVHRQRDTCAASPLGRGDDACGPVLVVSHDRRQIQLLDIAADGFWRLERVDHRHGAARRDEPDDRRGVRQPVAHHKTDRGIVGDPGVPQHRRDGVGVVDHIDARVPPATELDARPVGVAGQRCRERFGKAFGHG